MLYIIFAILVFGALALVFIGAAINNLVLLVIAAGIWTLCALAIPLRGLIKPFACAMGWHSYEYDYTGFDGASMQAKCQWCGFEGMVDSQGNLF